MSLLSFITGPRLTVTQILKSAVVAAILGVVGFGAGSAQANLSVCDAIVGNPVQNCGFEAGPYGEAQPTDWAFSTTAATSSSYIAGTANSGSNAYNFGATSPGFDTISQTLATTNGQAYTLSFYLEGDTAAGPSNELQASWNGTPVFTKTNDTSADYHLYSVGVTGTGSDTVAFSGYDDNTGFIYLDDVSLTVAVPEPVTLLVLGVGLSALGAVRRRGRR